MGLHRLGTYGVTRIPFSNPGALLGLSGQTTIVPTDVVTVAGRVILLLALVGVAWFALAHQLLSSDVTY